MKHLNDGYVLGLLKSAKASKEIATLLGITKRYANKLRRKLKAEGDECLINKNKGKQREWKTDKETEIRIVGLYSGKYNGSDFTHFLEKLNNREKISISYAALHRILNEYDIKSPKAQKKRKKDNAHPLRDRRKAFGELLQTDASIHPWFKGSNLKYALHGAIDDATGTVMGLCFDDSFTPWNKTKEELGYCLSTQHSRTIDNGSSFSLDCDKCCLVDEKHEAIVMPPKAKVNVFKTLGEKIVATYNGKYHETKLAASAEKHKIKPVEFKVETKPKWKPAPNHPWRKLIVSLG